MRSSRPSIPALLSATIAAVGVGGIVIVAKATRAGSAPGNGEQSFDAPGCWREHYDGPGHVKRLLPERNCPRPKPVILVRSSRVDGAWRVILDGSRSFDPDGEPIVRYEWDVGRILRLRGRVASLQLEPGIYTVTLQLRDESGSVGGTRRTFSLP
jgi:hypothetical protein